MKKVAVIGAGTAGLASAIRLRALGYDVTVYEKNEQVGRRMYQFKENGFTFDVGPTIVMMPKVYQELFTDSGVDYKDYIQMERIDPMFEIHYRDKTVLKATSDLVNMTIENEKFSEKDAQGYLAYIADVYKRYLVVKEHFIEKSFRGPLDFYNPKMLTQALKLKTFSTAYNSVGKFVKDERLKQSLAFQTLYIGISPYNGPSIYTIIPMIELLYGVHYIKGGMYSMAKAMERRFLEMGGKILLNQNVEAFIIENKTIKSLKVNGKGTVADSEQDARLKLTVKKLKTMMQFYPMQTFLGWSITSSKKRRTKVNTHLKKLIKCYTHHHHSYFILEQRNAMI